MFLRYMADTTDTTAGELALEYLRGLLRICPVRVASMTAGLAGRWEHYAALLTTPMHGAYINVVCCAPASWSWEQVVSMPQRNGKPETARHRIDLYTAGVRNVLIAGRAPTEPAQIATARQYECLIVPSEIARMGWEMNGAPDANVIPIPVTDHDAFRALVMG